MTSSDTPSPEAGIGLPHEFHHTHSDVSGGWLRAASFGAMDGLVSNTALIAGVAASADRHTVVLSGIAGLLAGAFSMAMGEYTSVKTANEQIDSEVRLERRAFRMHPQAEQEELVQMLVQMGMTEKTARAASEEVHQDENQAVNFHMVQELGVDPREKPSPRLAAISSFILFAIASLAAGLLCGGVGLAIAGAAAARYTNKPVWWASGRQLAFGAIAIGATYVVGLLVGATA
jgi:VIT1/CCC1 family predicted Fe2+/Mn2+ transporter